MQNQLPQSNQWQNCIANQMPPYSNKNPSTSYQWSANQPPPWATNQCSINGSNQQNFPCPNNQEFWPMSLNRVSNPILRQNIINQWLEFFKTQMPELFSPNVKIPLIEHKNFQGELPKFKKTETNFDMEKASENVKKVWVILLLFFK